VATDAQKTPVEGVKILPYEKGKPYTVTYEANGATGDVPTQPAVEGGKTVTVLSAGTLERTGYDFDGWNTLATGKGTGYAAGAEIAVTGNITLYAQWKPQTGKPTTVKVGEDDLPGDPMVITITKTSEPTATPIEFARNDAISLTATVAPNDEEAIVGTTYTWYLDGVKDTDIGNAGATFTKTAGSVSINTHTLVVVVTIDNVDYSSEPVTFKVADKVTQ
jgi:uncharacterized repeat protein (TIGR02543 family)